MIRFARKINTPLCFNTAFFKTDTKIQNKIGYIYLNSQKDFNALSHQMKANLVKHINNYEASNDVKAIVLLSKVKKAFCAGANIKEFEGKKNQDFVNNDIFAEIHDTFNNAKKPIIAGVNGVALGGGCEIALLCDIVFCSEQARFGLPQLRLGLIPGIGGTQRFARIAGKVNAMRYIMTSEFINAKRAYEMGLVSEVFKTEQMHQKVIDVATEIVNKPLSALMAAKDAIKKNEELSMKEGIAYQRKIFYPLFDTQGVTEGVNAFVEKRKPKHLDL